MEPKFKVGDIVKFDEGYLASAGYDKSNIRYKWVFRILKSEYSMANSMYKYQTERINCEDKDYGKFSFRFEFKLKLVGSKPKICGHKLTSMFKY